ncbi:MAG: peptidylprolyl isomerase [Oscillospiraceae bacterium]|nr:peptidylprolyl isomerase [Oscillospiraceae bacterium]
MSASDKKKLRKEQNATALTEKQKQAKKEAKQLKAYTISFVVVIVLVVAIVLGVTLKTPVNGMIIRNTHAVTIGEREISSAELNYFYLDTVSNFYSEYNRAYSSYGDYVDLMIQMNTGLVPGSPLGDQKYDATTGETWADYFINAAKEKARLTYAIYDEAMAKGFKLDEEDQEYLDGFKEYMNLRAKLSNYSSAASYLRGMYGDGASLKTYKQYTEVCTVASAYAEEYYNSLEYTDSDYREHEKDKYNEFSSYTFATHYIAVKDYLTGGTTVTDEDGKTTIEYSDEEKAAAVEAAKKIAESLAIADNDTIEKLNAAIAALAQSKDDPSEDKTAGNETTGGETTGNETTGGETTGNETTGGETTGNETADGETTEDEKKEDTAVATAKEYERLLYSKLKSYLNEDAVKWISASDRQVGNITYVASTTEDKDGNETTNGFYVVLLVERSDNTYLQANVRHILIKFEGGTKDEDTGKTTYTDEEKAAAKQKAESILAEWTNGEKTEDSFAALAKEKSGDTGTKSNGGLIENINWDSGFVTSFAEWSLSEHKAGDTGIIESEYGYHIMYYVGDSDLTYRDSMIDTALTDADYEAWETSLTESITITDVNLKYINRDLVISRKNSSK